jgi:hypothetical protein
LSSPSEVATTHPAVVYLCVQHWQCGSSTKTARKKENMLDRLLQDTGEEEEVEFENIFLLVLVVMTYMSTSMNFVSRFRILGFLFSCPRVLSCTQFSPAP